MLRLSTAADAVEATYTSTSLTLPLFVHLRSPEDINPLLASLSTGGVTKCFDLLLNKEAWRASPPLTWKSLVATGFGIPESRIIGLTTPFRDGHILIQTACEFHAWARISPAFSNFFRPPDYSSSASSKTISIQAPFFELLVAPAPSKPQITDQPSVGSAVSATTASTLDSASTTAKDPTDKADSDPAPVSISPCASSSGSDPARTTQSTTVPSPTSDSASASAQQSDSAPLEQTDGQTASTSVQTDAEESVTESQIAAFELVRDSRKALDCLSKLVNHFEALTKRSNKETVRATTPTVNVKANSSESLSGPAAMIGLIKAVSNMSFGLAESVNDFAELFAEVTRPVNIQDRPSSISILTQTSSRATEIDTTENQVQHVMNGADSPAINASCNRQSTIRGLHDEFLRMREHRASTTSTSSEPKKENEAAQSNAIATQGADAGPSMKKIDTELTEAFEELLKQPEQSGTENDDDDEMVMINTASTSSSNSPKSRSQRSGKINLYTSSLTLLTLFSIIMSIFISSTSASVLVGRDADAKSGLWYTRDLAGESAVAPRQISRNVYLCKCTCFQTNSTLVPIYSPVDAAKPCTTCTRQFCLDQNLDICKDAKLEHTDHDVGTGLEGDVWAKCFERDSYKDQSIITLYLLVLVGLVVFSALRGRLVGLYDQYQSQGPSAIYNSVRNAPWRR